MRIYGNRQLKTLPGLETRPTTGRVREAVFNIWQNRVEGCRWLDLCAGNGSMGAEALCRGAGFVVGIEQNAKACAIIRQNWEKVASVEQFQVIKGNVLSRLPQLAGQTFDFIYFDPPYDSPLYPPVLSAIAQLDLLSPDGEMALEHRPEQESFELPSGLEICRQKVYGNTALTFIRRLESGV
ncbi:16S rRNA (guanine(966)-N(2))-methyltransferase RsmD [Desertifilum sp. FACHB-1129]|uniref:16S rRNA (Guanine(966)-N(2))-methyltransferase RsmD n=2 Tax=Desertifilum tharense IPPAS B-1220 TaxID=1781255 RepID=A0A1E5QJ16_9CYAN|nr:MULTISPECIES: 16S rRNA (guanine(966)-N(2))-methyltransferase RsmD [Desertifilum]MDA0212554.1 16S rRNA (guanine(966)-N(2))-methyltransferase RsmD [Cyanobacteria bacterium FC1]MBD2315049.1 16S rRNA (guanine(966)-N(2))-methyltransferase RsmD [Desertifilum sp. FACHB-1129]MBD2324972.1 16S rRNA (guanine(966)-N(2))-methyltransferase RsmD [Desertifilum sp. FACHB-866]MBD2335111.1 16S rRNA (guanine(966)-N(2))-methyltransferase RsmD [Desertifilum sp. FACHB-868]OEJ74601.1 16S rRNA (guanine(966)-N(2))-m